MKVPEILEKFSLGLIDENYPFVIINSKYWHQREAHGLIDENMGL